MINCNDDALVAAPNLMDRIQNLPVYIKFAIVSIGIFAIVCSMHFAQNIILPLIYAIIIAIVLSPIVNFLVRKKFNRILAISITLITVIGFSMAILIWLSSRADMKAESFTMLLAKFELLLHQGEAWVSETFNIRLSKVKIWTNDTKAEAMVLGKSLVGRTLVNIGSVLVVLVLIPVYVFLVLYYRPLLMNFIHQLFSAHNHTEVNKVLSATKKIIQSYLIGLMLEALIIATLNSASLLIIGIDYAILLGVIGAVLNLIPYIGGIIAVSLPMLIALATKSPTSAFLVLGAYIVIQFIDNNYIIARVVASKVQLNALVSMVVVICGGAIWGVPGMFLSIPLTAIIKVIFDHIDGLKPWGYLLGDRIMETPPIEILPKI